jgi:hypothetical protein
MFERFAGGGDAAAVQNRFTAEDVVAVSMLAVNVPALAALKILGDDAETLSALLAAIPADVDLVDADDEMIGSGTPAWRLWDQLDSYADIGTTITSKLMARKRPRLIPVQDTRVLRALNHPREFSFWEAMRHHLRRDDRALSAWLRRVREASGVGGDISEIRVLDVLVWKEESAWAASERGPLRRNGSPDNSAASDQ